MDTLTGFGETNRITETRFDITAVCEAGGEYSMPDYYPEIRRIVSYTCDALPDTKFLSGDTLEAGGTMAFTVIYIGENGALVSLPYTTEYSGKTQLPSEVRGTNEVYVDDVCEDIQCRVLAPRKISIRGRVRRRIYSDCEREYTLNCSDGDGAAIDAADRSGVQTLEGALTVMTCGRGMITGNASGEIRDRQGGTPVSCMGTVNITDAHAVRDAVAVTGQVAVRCLVFTTDGAYAQAKGTIPFEQVISAQGAKEGDCCRAWGRVASVSVSVSDDGQLKVDAEYDIDAEWCRMGNVKVTEDAYSTAWASRVEKSDISLMSPVCCLNSPLTVSGSGKRTTKPQNGEYLIDMCGEAFIDGVEIKGDRAVFTGKCKVKAYIAADGEVICEEILLPVKYECGAMSVSDGGKPVIRSFVSLADISGRLEGDNVFVSCELCLSISCRQMTRISPVTSVVLDKKAPVLRECAQIKVFYPRENIRVWDVAKKYLCDVGTLESVNGVRRNENCSDAVLIPGF